MAHFCHVCGVLARSLFRAVFAEGHESVGYWCREDQVSSEKVMGHLPLRHRHQIKATRGFLSHGVNTTSERKRLSHRTPCRAARALGDAMPTSLFATLSAADAPTLRICNSR